MSSAGEEWVREEDLPGSFNAWLKLTKLVVVSVTWTGSMWTVAMRAPDCPTYYDHTTVVVDVVEIILTFKPDVVAACRESPGTAIATSACDLETCDLHEYEDEYLSLLDIE